VDSLLQRLSEHSSSPLTNVDSSNPGQRNQYDHSSNGSVPITPATDEFHDTQAIVFDAIELQRLRAELQEARSEVARMNQELHTTHQIKSTFDHAMGQGSEAEYYYKGEISEQTISQLQNRFNASTRPNVGRQESWSLAPEDSLSERGDIKSFGQAIWGNGARPAQYPVVTNTWGVSVNANTQDLGHSPVRVFPPSKSCISEHVDRWLIIYRLDLLLDNQAIGVMAT
jgi:hypothetical protein